MLSSISQLEVLYYVTAHVQSKIRLQLVEMFFVRFHYIFNFLNGRSKEKQKDNHEGVKKAL